MTDFVFLASNCGVDNVVKNREFAYLVSSGNLNFRPVLMMQNGP
jgi:hypothetical protein